jgi:monofunctional biosynthetic peptidoglycan transglycosylase
VVAREKRRQQVAPNKGKRLPFVILAGVTVSVGWLVLASLPPSDGYPAGEVVAERDSAGSTGHDGSQLDPTAGTQAPENKAMETGQKRASKTLFRFDKDGPTGQWILVNDTVMGGVSESGLVATGDGTALFSGTVSLENNGGFASVRTVPQLTPLGDYSGIELRVRGAGNRYQLRLRTDGNFDGVAYRGTFESVSEEWRSVRLPFSEFEPTFRGRTLTDYPQLDADRITTFGLMITDKQAGRFDLEIAWIKAYAS